MDLVFLAELPINKKIDKPKALKSATPATNTKTFGKNI